MEICGVKHLDYNRCLNFYSLHGPNLEPNISSLVLMNLWSNFMTKKVTEKQCVTQILNEQHIKGRLRNNNTICKPTYEKQNHLTFRRK